MAVEQPRCASLKALSAEIFLIASDLKVGRKTSAKKFRANAKDLNLWLKAIINQVLTKNCWKTLCSKLRGHYEYYGVSKNYRSIDKFYTLAIRVERK